MLNDTRLSSTMASEDGARYSKGYPHPYAKPVPIVHCPTCSCSRSSSKDTTRRVGRSPARRVHSNTQTRTRHMSRSPPRSHFQDGYQGRSHCGGAFNCRYCGKRGHVASRCWYLFPHSRHSSRMNRYCSYHNSPTHDTEHCVAKRRSGEAERPSFTKPP